jgi:hypothetical protein
MTMKLDRPLIRKLGLMGLVLSGFILTNLYSTPSHGHDEEIGLMIVAGISMAMFAVSVILIISSFRKEVAQVLLGGLALVVAVYYLIIP